MTQNPQQQVKIQTVEKNFDKILQKVGNQSYVNWDSFTKNSTQVVRAIDGLNNTISLFRQTQHQNFIQTMKKLKSLDLPDLIKTVKAKKLPKQALRSVLTRFKLHGDQLDLIQTPEQLKENALKQFQIYSKQNQLFVQQLTKFNDFINQKIKQSGYLVQKKPQIKQIKATVKFNLSEEKAQSLASNIQIQYLPNTHQLIGLKTYTQIVENSYDLIKTQYEKLTYEARKKQRDSVQDHKSYLQIMNEYLLNSQALILQGQNLLAIKVGVNKLEDSEIALMERGLANNVLMIQSQLRGKIKQCLPPSKDVNLEVAKEVIEYQTKMIDQKSDYIKQVLSGLEKTQEATQLIPMLLALILNDMVFEKYGYEEQDFIKNVGEEAINTNPDLEKIFKNMEIAIIRLMQKLEVIPQDMAKYMEQAASMKGQQPQQGMIPPGMQQNMIPGMMPGMPPGGLMPGSNPMDLLQFQQMQMHQMFAQMGQQLPK